MFKSCLTSYERNKYLEIKILVNIRKYQIGEAVVLEMAIVVKKYAKVYISKLFSLFQFNCLNQFTNLSILPKIVGGWPKVVGVKNH